jgi:thioester reductase-like protein
VGYLLLTGATGLLGRYLLRDALRAGMQVAVLVRCDGALAPHHKIDAILREEEAISGAAYARPVVLQGDLQLPDCGLDHDAVQWVRRNCQAVVHCAASLSFQESGDGEPRRTNVEGTGNLLNLCKLTGIRAWHHVSTAYVAGRRTGRVHEDELNVGQVFSNDYERSKCESEQLVRQAGHLDSVTVFRPSIIVGDSKTARTSSFHGFYTPLRLGVELARGASSKGGTNTDTYFRLLGLRGDERKNLVPVDWVSAVLTHVVRHSEHHGKTYHLTSSQPIPAQELDNAITDTIEKTVGNKGTGKAGRKSRSAPTPAIVDNSQFIEGMRIYRDYFRNDPEFDTTNTRRAAPHLPCPVLDRAALERLAEYAISVNFGWPRQRAVAPKFDVGQQLDKLGLASDWSTVGSLGLNVFGPGGGGWQIKFSNGRPVACGAGWSEPSDAVAHLHVETLESLIRSKLTIRHAIEQGRLVLIAQRAALSTAEDWLDSLMTLWRSSRRSSTSRRPSSSLQENTP